MSGKGRGKEAVLPAWMTNPSLYGKEIPKNGGHKEIKYARQVYCNNTSSDEKIRKNQSSRYRSRSRSRSRSPSPIPFVKIPPKSDSAAHSSSKRYRSPTPPRIYKRREVRDERMMYADEDSVDNEEDRYRGRGERYQDARRH